MFARSDSNYYESRRSDSTDAWPSQHSASPKNNQACASTCIGTCRFDTNGDGRVSYREFYKVLSRERAGSRRTSTRGRFLWEEDDAVRASVDALVEELYDRREYVLEMLERMDTNGTGYLSRAEMKRGLERLTPNAESAGQTPD